MKLKEYLSQRGKIANKARNKKLSAKRRKEISVIANKQKSLMAKAIRNEKERLIKLQVNKENK